MSTFPLYDNLYNEIQDLSTPLNEDEKIFFTLETKKLGEHECEIMYALIRTHQLKHGKICSYIIPYGGKKLKKGIKFDLNNIPTELSKILYRFLNIHNASVM